MNKIRSCSLCFLLTLFLFQPESPAQPVVGGKPFYEFKTPVKLNDTISTPYGQGTVVQVGLGSPSVNDVAKGGVGLNNAGQIAVPVLLQIGSDYTPAALVEGPFDTTLRPEIYYPPASNPAAFYLSASYNDAGTIALHEYPFGGLTSYDLVSVKTVDGPFGFLYYLPPTPEITRFAHQFPEVSEDDFVTAHGEEWPANAALDYTTNWLMRSAPMSPVDGARVSSPVSKLAESMVPPGRERSFYPVIANGGMIAVMAGDSANSASILRVPPGEPPEAIATAPGGFEWLAPKVAMTENGEVIAFMGRDASGAEGLFITVYDPVFNVPVPSIKITTNGTLGFNSAGGKIHFTRFITNVAPRIIRHDRYDDGEMLFEGDQEGDSLLIAFMAVPSQPSITAPGASRPMMFSDRPGIWVARFDFQRGMTNPNPPVINFRTITPVIQEGDLIDGFPITELYLTEMGRGTRQADGDFRQTADGNPEPGDHVIAFWAKTPNGVYAVKAYHLDTDGDGLLDHWERAGGGIDMDGDGVVELNLASLGASMRRKDIFLELDWTAPRPSSSFPGGWFNQPTFDELLLPVVDYFAQAPVANLDGSTGISLHIDAGEGLSQNGMLEADPVDLRGGQIVTRSDGARPDQIIMYRQDDLLAGNSSIQFVSLTMNNIKNRYFLNHAKGARELAFRYGVLGDFALIQPISEEVIFEVDSANTTEISAQSTNVSAFFDFPLDTNAVYVALMLDGPAAGQVRRCKVQGPPWYDPLGLTFTITVVNKQPPWRSAPVEGNRLILFTSNGGISEVFFHESPPGNYHRLPGNEFAITLGGTRVRSDFGLGDATKVARVMVHELGHTMGLTHGGHDSCAYKGSEHHSRMSYSHTDRQLPTDNMEVHSETCSVERNLITGLDFLPKLYSSGMDIEGLNEYEYLRMAPWGTPWMIGNSYHTLDATTELVHRQDEPLPEPLPDDGDRHGPRIFFPPVTQRVAALSSPLVVTVTVQDVSGVALVDARFDVNGDGRFSNATERVAGVALGGEVYALLFTNVTGSSTGRLLTVHAIDALGNGTTRKTIYRVGGASVADVSAPLIYTLDSNPFITALDEPLDVRMSVYEESTGPLGGVSAVEFTLDSNGDGVTNELAETQSSGLDVDGNWRTRFAVLGGPPGNRRVRVVAEDMAGNRRTNTSFVVRLVPADTTNPVIIAVSPTNQAVVPLGPSALSVSVSARDESRLKSITVLFDANGNGIITGAQEVASTQYFNAETNVNAAISIGGSGITGSEGNRLLTVRVEDYAGRTATTSVTLQVKDTESPRIVIQSPMIDQIIQPGTNFTITGSATDNQRVTSLVVRVDLDGDGFFNGVGEIVSVPTNQAAAFNLSFAGFTGPLGPRRVQVQAWDPLGQMAVQDYFIHVAPGLRAWSPVAGDRISIGSSVMVVVEAPRGTNIVMALDLNGDGDRIDPGESVTGVVRQINVQATEATRVTEAVLGPVEGLSGPRDLVITGVETSGAPLNLVIPLMVTNDALFAASRTRRLGSIPVHADPINNQEPVELFPQRILPYQSNILFIGRTPTEGETLWISDGTRKGTRMIADPNPDRISSGSFINQPSGMGTTAMIEFNGKVYFNAQDQEGSGFSGTTAKGNELWVTDGTAEGTYLLKDINPAVFPAGDSSFPGPFAVYSNRLIFAAQDNVRGRELWISDGTETGTVLLADMSPGLIGTGPEQFVPMGGRLWFLVSRLSLWSTDGTTTGTVKAMDLPPFGVSSISVDKLAVAGNRLFFEFHDSTNGWELWSTDGTATGLVMMADIAPGSASSFPQNLFALSNRIWFTANSSALGRELYVSDGTPGGTALVRDFFPGSTSGNPRNFRIHRGRLWFSATDAISGEELWSTDGTPEGLRRETEIGRVSGPLASGATATQHTAQPTSLWSFAENLYLQADDQGLRHGDELWVIDTNGLARMIRDLSPTHARRNIPGFVTYTGPDNGNPQEITGSGDRLFLRGRDSLYGNQLFVSDGTAAGTVRLGGRVWGRGLPEMQTWNGMPVFAALTGNGGRWMTLTNGQLVTHALPLPLGSSGPSNITASFNGLAFEANLPPNQFNQVFVGVYAVSAPGAEPVLLRQLLDCWRIFPAGRGWMFTGRDTNSVDRMWLTDGTVSGTHLITNLNITANYGTGWPLDVVQMNTQTLFNMSVRQQAELWYTDGTPGNTRRVAVHGTNEHPFFSTLFTTNGNRIGLFATGSNFVKKFFVLTAINSNAVEVAALTDTGNFSDGVVRPVVANGKWVFSALAAHTNLPLWISDGTTTGTVGFGLATSGRYPAGRIVETPRRLTAIGSRLYFAAGNGLDGEEPFVTDLETLSTRNLGNLYTAPGAGLNPNSSPRAFTPLGGWVLFVAADGNRGEELWRTDGTEDGTIFLKDIFPGRASSEIASPVIFSNRMYFTARTPAGGRELWSTDGTTQGTLPVEDLMPGPGASDPQRLIVAGTNLCFMSLDGAEDGSLHELAAGAQPMTPFQQWISGFTLPGGFASQPWEDGDGDGWSNEMEFLFQTDPVNPMDRHPINGLGMQVVYFPETATDYFLIHYDRPAHWQELGLWFQFESAYYLPQFSPTTAETVAVQNLGDMERVTVRIYTKDLCCPNSPRPDFFFARIKVNRD